MDSDICLVVENVSRVFGGLKAVDGVNLTIRPGERRALIGPNGAGKTTLFNLISGEVPVGGGAIRFFGVDVTRFAPHQRAALGMARTFQITRLFPNLSVLENVRWRVSRWIARSSRCFSRSGIARRWLSGRRRYSKNLGSGRSEGLARHLPTATSGSSKSRCRWPDGPAAAARRADGRLAGGERDSMRQLLDALDPAIAVLLIEHDMDVAFALADKVTVLYQGAVLAHGLTSDVAANPQVQQVYLGARGLTSVSEEGKMGTVCTVEDLDAL